MTSQCSRFSSGQGVKIQGYKMIRWLLLVVSIAGVFITYPLVGFHSDSVSYWSLFFLIAFSLSVFVVVAKIIGINGKVKGGRYDYPMND
jgi:uncharacterized Tic20 family protein